MLVSACALGKVAPPLIQPINHTTLSDELHIGPKEEPSVGLVSNIATLTQSLALGWGI